MYIKEVLDTDWATVGLPNMAQTTDVVDALRRAIEHLYMPAGAHFCDRSACDGRVHARCLALPHGWASSRQHCLIIIIVIIIVIIIIIVITDRTSSTGSGPLNWLWYAEESGPAEVITADNAEAAESKALDAAWARMRNWRAVIAAMEVTHLAHAA